MSMNQASLEKQTRVYYILFWDSHSQNLISFKHKKPIQNLFLITVNNKL